MSKLKITTYELRDVAIMQAPVSFCNHRGDVNNLVTICGRECYPVFVAPMASVTDAKNYKVWIENKLATVVPRSVMKTDENPNGLSFEDRMEIAKETFVSISLSEAQTEFFSYMDSVISTGDFADDLPKHYICVDIANGTMSDLYDVCRKIKTCYKSSVEIMTGNVANLDDVYKFYADAGIDWVRAGIGGGSRCTTSANDGVHVGMATLIDSLNESRKKYYHSHNGYAPTKIIADGGIANFDDINKAIALGADAVMCGNLIARSEEACEKVVMAASEERAIAGDYIPLDLYNDIARRLNDEDMFRTNLWTEMCSLKPFREYYGMSTKRAQRETGGDGKKTAEGISRPVPVEYPIAKWVDNMQSFLRSTMTYTNSRTIKELQENAQMVILGGSGDAAYRK